MVLNSKYSKLNGIVLIFIQKCHMAYSYDKQRCKQVDQRMSYLLPAFSRTDDRTDGLAASVVQCPQ